ncbi:hypothetical protein FQZ97_931830 [compost metagenome]
MVNREVFLQHLEGLPFGDSAETGVRRGQNFYHAELDFTLHFPDGWELVNRPDAVITHSADQQAFVAMTMDGRKPGVAPADYLRQKAGGRSLAMEESLQQSGLQGATAVLPGNPARRVAVAYKDDKAYLFVGAIRNGASLESQDQHFLSVIRSFRALNKEELALAQPLRLHMIQVKPGQTIASLAWESKLPGSQAELENRIRLLNNLYPIGEPKPGDWLKVVR